MRQEKVDIVHTHLWTASFWGRIAARLAAVPVIVITEHNVYLERPKHMLFIDKLLSSITNKIIAVSEEVKNFCIDKTHIREDKIQIIYNGIDTKVYSDIENDSRTDLKKEFRIKDDDIVLGIVGRLVKQKGHRYFLEAIKELSLNYPVKGLVVGSGELEEECKKYSDSLDLNGTVIFTGLQRDIPRFFKLIDITVMPSSYEGFPITALESMASGVPVVAFDVGGMNELILNNKNGFLVRPGDLKDLVHKIELFVHDKNLREQMGRFAISYVKEKFTVDTMVNKTEEIYEDLLKNSYLTKIYV
jgi:glycosyltransferase involved in cell wall biosynthesis